MIFIIIEITTEAFESLIFKNKPLRVQVNILNKKQLYDPKFFKFRKENGSLTFLQISLMSGLKDN